MMFIAAKRSYVPYTNRHGYALEASTGYLYHIFSTHPKLTVAAICKRENNPSIQLLEKIGFTFNCIMEKDKDPLNLFLLKKEDLIH